MKKCWVVSQGRYYSEVTFIESIYPTKAEAENHCKYDGYKFNKRQGIFLNDECQRYRNIEQHKVSRIKTR